MTDSSSHMTNKNPSTKSGWVFAIIFFGSGFIFTFGIVTSIAVTAVERAESNARSESAISAVREAEKQAKNDSADGRYFDTAGAPDSELTHGETPIRIGTDETGSCYLLVAKTENGSYFWTSNETLGNHSYSTNTTDPVSDCANIVELIEQF